MSRRPLLSLFLGLLLVTLSVPTHAQETSLRPLAGQREGLPSDGTTAMAWDGSTLWIGTTRGLGRWDGARAWTIEFPLAERHIQALYAEGDSLWAGTAGGIARLVGETWQSWERGEAGLLSGWGTSFTAHQSALYAGTYGGGVHRWTGTSWEPVGPGGATRITTLASDGERLWAGTPTGILAWDGVTWTGFALPAEPFAVRALLYGEDTIWAGGDRGLVRWSGESWEATGIGDRVTALATTPAGLAVATTSGLAILDGAGAPVAAGTTSLALRVRSPVPALVNADGQLFAATLGRGVWWSGTEEKAMEPPAPRLPVVLVHGLGDPGRLEGSNLRFLAQWLQRDGHTVSMAAYEEDEPLLASVSGLRRAIATVKRESGQAQVIVIGHSFGGLIARAYLSSGATDVAGLATLGSPHAGVRLVYDSIVSDLPVTPAPSRRVLLPEHASVLEPFMDVGTVPQLHVGGNILPEDNLFDGFPPHDGIITAASAVAAPGATRVVPLLHGWSLLAMEYGIPSFPWPDDFYLNTLRPWMQRIDEGDPWTDRVTEPPLPAPGFTGRPLLAQVLAPGETITVTTALDEQPATWFMQGPGVVMDLIAPDGTRYSHDRFLVGDTVAHLPYRENLLQPLDLWSTRRRAGLWQAALTNQSDLAVAARLVLVPPLGPSLEINFDEPWVAPASPLRVSVRGEADLEVTATVGGLYVPLDEGAPGEYSALLEAPETAGYHPVHVLAEQEDGTFLERWAVIGVRSANATVINYEQITVGDDVLLRLQVRGTGSVALGTRVVEATSGAATAQRLTGPFRLPASGTRTLIQRLPQGARLEWQLFDAAGALVPVTSLTPVEMNP
jgi:pimeloyl-ACP methyl ester carboxylesterase